VVEALRPPRSMSYSPIFQVMLSLNNLPTGGELSLPGLTLSPVESSQQTTHFDLSLSLNDRGDAIGGTLVYASDLFEHSTIERLAGHFQQVLAAMVADEQQRVSALPLLSAPQRRQLLVDFNDTAAPYPHDQLIHQLFEAQAAIQPDAIALVLEEQQLSYGQLNRRANQLAHHLLALGVQPDDRVAICAERSLELIVGLLGILKAGGAYVPLDPGYPADRLAFMLADSAPVALLTQSAHVPSLPALTLPMVVLDADNGPLNQQADSNPVLQDLSSAHLAYVTYTSGSTGMPKGVMIAHHNVIQLVINEPCVEISPRDRMAYCANPAFDASTWEIWGALLNGAAVVIIPQAVLLEPADFARMLQDQRVTILQLTAGLFREYADRLAPVFGRLQYLLFGGDQSDIRTVRKVFTQSPPAHLVHTYGPTETTTFTTTHEVSDALIGATALPIGRPIANTQVYILDAHLQPVPLGVTGELYIGGAGVARGYLNRPELSAERFLADPFSSAANARMYKTGDLGRWLADGSIEYQGRNDFQVKIRGFRIELGEVEARLAACAGVREAVVLAREDGARESAHGDKRLVAYLVAQDGVTLDAGVLRTDLASVLADYMMPSAFVTLDSLPLTANGKLDRRALPAPDQDAHATRAYEAPVGAIETALAAIWQDLLSVERVGRHDHFFELGGHSLMVISMIERLRQRDLFAEVRTVFTTPTLAAMASAMQASHDDAVIVPPNLIGSDCTAITPDLLPLVDLTQDEIDSIVLSVPGGAANIQDIYPLAPLQEGILFHHMLESEGDTYLVRHSLFFDGRAQLDAFLLALQTVIDRHDILRTSIHWNGLSQPVQLVQRQAPLPIHTMILDADGDAIEQLHARTDPRHVRLDLQRAPLLAAHIAADPHSSQWMMVLLNHHIVSDHVTIEMIVAEIQALLQGRGGDLPRPLPYRNFIAQARALPESAHEAYFRSQLADIDEPTAPFGVLDLQGTADELDEAHLALPDDLAQRIRDIARSLGVTAAVLFHTAWAQVLAKCTGREDLVFGTVLSGRLQGMSGADRILGLFINTLPVRISLAGGAREVVLDTYQRLTELLDHEQASLALAQRCSAVAASMPLFTTLLNYRHNEAGAATPESHAANDTAGGVRVRFSKRRTNYPVTFAVDDLGRGFGLTVQCTPGISAERLVGYVNSAIEALVQALEDNPKRPVNSLAILPASEREQLLVGFNDTAAPYPHDQLIHQLFEAQAAVRPDAVAVVYQDQQLTYDQLNRRANQLAHHLLGLGVQPDDRVAIYAERSLDMIVGLLGILKAGGAYVPLDPSYPTDRLAYMLADSTPVALLTQAALVASLPALTLPLVVLDADSAGLHHQADGNPDPAQQGLTARHLAYVIYTSGSTGKPKGVMVEHRNIVNYLRWADETYYQGTEGGSPAVHSIGFDGLLTTLYGPLVAGQALTLLPTGREVDALANEHGPLYGLLKLTPSHLRMLNAELGEHGSTPTQALMVGGEALVPSDIAFWQRRFPQVRLINHFGPTETTVGCATFEIGGDAGSLVSIPIGRPIANTRIYILDPRGEPVPIGVAGELCVGGAGVARGYLNRPELTAERFVPDPFSAEPDARMYKTGDLGRWLADGNIDYLGRNDFQVKIRGYRIELGEIETALTACAGVRDAVVIAREDTVGDKRLAAYLVAHEGAELAPAALRAELGARLPDYMVPSAFVLLDAFPLTVNGKLDRKALPAPDQSALITREYEAPRGELETALAGIWQDLLGMERVGRHDHFFELGGHSLLATQVVSKIRARLGHEVPLRALFEDATVAALAARIDQSDPGSGLADRPAIGRAPRDMALPLSFGQQRLWFLDQFASGNALYTMPAALRLRGTLDADALGRSINEVVRRHEALRTTFAMVGGIPVQVIAASVGIALAVTDLSALAEPERQARTLALAQEEAQKPFDLEKGPLLRAGLLKLAVDEHVLLFTMHHIVSDGWSIGVLVEEIGALYAACLDGREAPLPALPIQYADYACWQRQWLSGAVLDKQVGYWRDRLSGAPALLTLPTDRPRPAVQTYGGAAVPLLLDAVATSGLHALARRIDGTLFMVLTAAFNVLLSRYSGQEDICVGTAIANRTQGEIEPLIGFFVNTLVLRTQVDGKLGFMQLLDQVRTTTLEAYEHQDVPFEYLVEVLKPERHTGHSPLFQTMLVLQNTPQEALTLPGLTLEMLAMAQTSAKFDLTLSLGERQGQLAGTLEYNTDLFERATIERMARHFERLLAAIVEQPGVPVGELPLMGEAELHQQLVDWNGTEVAYAQECCVHALFEAQAAKTPDALAVVFGQQRLTYRELNERANRLAHYLMARGVRPDSLVAICAKRSVEMVVALLGVLKAGAAYVPLDAAYPAERLAYMLQDSQPVLLLTQEALRSSLPCTVPSWCLDSQWDELAAYSATDPVSVSSPEHLAYVIYTSGSTGKPKGVAIEQRGMLNYLSWALSCYRTASAIDAVVSSPIAFDATITSLYLPLLSGGHVYLIPDGDELTGLSDLLRTSRDSRIIKITPSHLDVLGQELRAAGVQCAPQTFVVGGEALGFHTAEMWKQISPRSRLINEYGPTETVVGCSIYEVGSVSMNRTDVPIGRPIANTQIYLLDERMQPVPVGVAAELYIGGAGVARGYLNRPELTAERFVRNPFSSDPAARMYRSGDLARYLPDGNIDYLGRIDHQVKIRGFRIEPGEIEAALMAQEGVRDAVVLAREDAPGDKRLAAYVVPHDGVALQAAQLRGSLQASLPEYMVPAHIVLLERLPLTPNGKVDRKALPKPDVAHGEAGYVAPRSATEAALAAIWADVLALAQVGVHDNFFELGGHSLLAVTLTERMRHAGLPFDVRALFATPTIAALAQTMSEAFAEVTVPANGIPDECEAITPQMLPLVQLTQAQIDGIASGVAGGMRNIQDIYPLAPLQEGILFHHLMQETGDTYLQRRTLAFDSRERLDKFVAALQMAIDRHDILRTAVHWDGLEEAVQVVWRKAPLLIEEVLVEDADADADEQLNERFDPGNYRLDVRQAPLMRGFIANDRRHGRWLLQLLSHHLVSDHTTQEILVEEIRQTLLGRALPAALPFRNYVAQAKLGIAQAEHEAFFRDMLADVDEPTAPFGLRDTLGHGGQIAEARTEVDPLLTRRIRQQARRLGVAAASVMHLAWAQVLGKLCGREHVVFGTVLFGRMQGGAGADRAMGLFINTLPIRLDLGAQGVEDSVRATHRRLSDLLRHEHAPLVLAQRCSAVAASVPLFSVLLNYRYGVAGSAQDDKPASGLDGIRLLGNEERTNYPLTLSVDDMGEGFRLIAQVSAGIAPQSICDYMHTALEGLVQALEASPQMPIHQVGILSDSERHRQMVEWNATGMAPAQAYCVHTLFEQQAAKTPDALAVVFGQEGLTYRELNERANRLAHFLRQTGVGADSVVGICVPRSLEMIVAVVGVLKAGGAYLPLDPAYPAERLAYMVEDSRLVMVLTTQALKEIVPGTAPAWCLDSQWQQLDDYPVEDLAPVSLPHHLAYVIYTSGSTGKPKGIEMPIGALVNLISWQTGSREGECRRARVLQFASLNFDVSFQEIFSTICAGDELVLVSEDLRQDLNRLLGFIAHARIDRIFLPNAVLQYFASVAHEVLLPDSGINSCEIITAGEQLVVTDALVSLMDLLGASRLHNQYGPSETHVVTQFSIAASDLHRSPTTPPIGRPIANTQIYLLDERLQPVPVGVAAELYIGGAGVARGYLNRPELTAERFVRNPFSSDPAARMYRSGDLARYLPDGNIDYLGRIDHQVKIRGFRIEPGEIEAALMAQEGVRDAVVLAREDAPGDKRLAAYVVAHDGVALQAAQLRGSLQASLPEYMVPAHIVLLERLPLTPNGKVDRKALPKPDVMHGEAGYVAPRSATEAALAAIWVDVLALAQVGVHDNFFELGGHSLLAVQLVSRVRQTLGVELPLREVFEQQTLARLAAVLAGAARADLPPILPADRNAPLPLSWGQQRLWFIDQLDHAASAAYHIPAALKLQGKLDRAALDATLDQLVARHESLRTRFVLQNGEPVQMIDPAGIGMVLREHDLRALAGHEQEAAVVRLAADEAWAPFDLATGPLVRARLLVLAPEEHVLLVTQHHIVSDGWSIGILVREVSALYTAFSQGLPDPLAPPALQYADYAVWQRTWLQGERLQGQLGFWRDHLSGAPALLELPLDRPRPPLQSHAGASVGLVLDPALSAGLRQLAARHGATLFMTLLAGWSLLLSRMSGQKDVVVGTPVANRQRAETEPLIGFFVNTLALRMRLDDDPTVDQLLRQMRTTTLEAYANQDVPFEQVVEVLNLQRSLSYSPLFQVMFSLNNTPDGGALRLPGLTLAPVESSHHTARFDLSLSLTDQGDAIGGALEYASDLFERSTIERLVGHFQQVLAAMVADERQRVSALPLLSMPQRQQLLVDFNDTAAPYPHDRLIHALFEEQAAARPDALAAVCQDQQLTYDQLNRRANQLAHHLLALGVRPDDRVAICAERSLDMIVGLIGILKAGAAYLPLDPANPADRLHFMIADGRPVALLTQASLRARMPEVALPVILLDADSAIIGRQADSNPDPAVQGLNSRHLACVIYTSGSTGVPKGVMIEHRGVIRLTVNNGFAALGAHDRVANCASPAFDATTWEVWGALLNGAAVVVVPQDLLLDASRFGPYLTAQGVSALLLPAGLFHQYASTLAPAFGGLRYLLAGGDALDPQVVRRVLAAPRRPRHVINAYGPTECSTVASCHRIETLPAEATSVPIGRPIANTEIYILDARLEPVPLGVTGELYLGGAGVARGYLNRPELTAERFLADPFSSAADARMYKTGDLGRWLPDGSIEYQGRNDFQVKIRGFRIELGEVEARLAACAGVREAALLARQDVPGDKRLVAYLVAQDGVTLDAGELRTALAVVLADYMIPSAFVTMDSLPLTANGKLDRSALPVPDDAALVASRYEEPVGATEQAIARIWEQLLGHSQIGRNANFFELGGHSLRVITLIEQLREAGLGTDVRTIFTYPTLSALAAAVDLGKHVPDHSVPPNLITADCAAITPDMVPLAGLNQEEIDLLASETPSGLGDIQDIYRLAPLQEGILFHHLLDAESDVYVIRSTIAFDSRARLDGFLAALQTVIDRHDILRTSIHWAGLRHPVQIVHRQAPLPVHTLTLDESGEAIAQFQQLTDPQRVRLDLRRAPLLAAYVAACPGSNECLLALLNHHIVSDHLTLELILNEIQLLLQKQEDRLPPVLPYRNFIAQVHSVSASEHEAFFRRQLADIDAPTAPFGLLDVQSNSKAVSEARLMIADELALRVRALARQHGVTSGSLFHTAWAQVLARCTGRGDVVFGTVLSGRLQGSAGADQVMGMFINTLPIRISLAGKSVNQAVRETQDGLADLLGHEQASLALAQRCSSVSPPLPLFSTLLNYRHSNSKGANPTAWTGIRKIASGDRTTYPITVSVDDLGPGFSLTTQCAPGIDAERINGYLNCAVESVAQALANNPERAVDTLAILPASERQQLLVGFNSATEYPQQALIHQRFEARAAASPDAIALVYGDQQLTYDQLNRRANQVAHCLLALGVQPNDRVALCAERSLDMIAGLIGILKAGAAYVPLDPGYPADRLAYMLADSAPVALLTQAALAPSLPAPTLPVVLLDGDGGLISQQADSNPDPALLGLTSRHLAYVIYTSGSTGTPKGVLVEHANISRLFTATDDAFQFGAADVWTLFHSVAFDFSVWEIWGALAFGGRLLVVSAHCARSPDEFYALLCSERVTILNQTPSAFRQLIAAQASAPAPHALRAIVFGGEALELHTLAPWTSRNDPERTLLINMYGITEITVHATYRRITQADIEARLGSTIGTPLPDLRTYILDAQLEPVPIGVTGELYIGGAGVARGYLNRPELTAERFLADPFDSAANARMYRTGDLGRWLPDGSIEYQGRNDFQVKIRGFRIELGEIEARLAACAGVREAVVLAREDVPGDRRLVAYLVAEDGDTLDAAALRTALAGVLADYMVPSAFVTLDSLPLTANGKLDRRALPAPDQSALLTRPYEAPVGAIETALADIWQDLLGVERVGRHDHFFELGGHSLLVVQLIVRIREHFHVEISVKSVFDAPALLHVAEAIKTKQFEIYLGEDLEEMEASLNSLSKEDLLKILAEENK
jgi:amino acid adenylation domain-containing protein